MRLRRLTTSNSTVAQFASTKHPSVEPVEVEAAVAVEAIAAEAATRAATAVAEATEEGTAEAAVAATVAANNSNTAEVEDIKAAAEEAATGAKVVVVVVATAVVKVAKVVAILEVAAGTSSNHQARAATEVNSNKVAEGGRFRLSKPNPHAPLLKEPDRSGVTLCSGRDGWLTRLTKRGTLSVHASELFIGGCITSEPGKSSRVEKYDHERQI